MARLGMVALSDDKGLELFDAARSMDEALVVPVPVDTAALRAQARAGTVPPLLRGLIRVSSRRAVDGGSLAQRLVGVPKEERKVMVLETVRSEAAIVLGHSSAEAIEPEQAFLEFGFDSLAAVELLNRLNAATGLRLSASLVFDYPTPAALAGYLCDLIADGSDAKLAAPSLESPGLLSAMFRQAHGAGTVGDFMALLMAASEFRPTFDEPSTLSPPALARLSQGPGSPCLICCPSIVAMSGPHQFARFAKSFREVRDVAALSVPGFLEGELLPATAQAVVEAEAETVWQAAAGVPFALVGYSSGGILALEVTAHLESTGRPPIAVVLIDPFVTDSRTAGDFQSKLMDRMIWREGEYIGIDDTRLIAMGAYIRLFSGWKPPEIAAPTLVVRATERMVDGSTGHDPSLPWDLGHIVEAPGDHFTVMEEHSDSTAQVVQSWLSTALLVDGT